MTQTLQSHLISEYNRLCEVLTFPYLCPISVLSLTTLPSSTASLGLPLSHSSHGSLHFLQVTSWVTSAVRPCLPRLPFPSLPPGTPYTLMLLFLYIVFLPVYLWIFFPFPPAMCKLLEARYIICFVHSCIPSSKNSVGHLVSSLFLM